MKKIENDSKTNTPTDEKKGNHSVRYLSILI
jgi:hypothetical protein